MRAILIWGVSGLLAMLSLPGQNPRLQQGQRFVLKACLECNALSPRQNWRLTAGSVRDTPTLTFTVSLPLILRAFNPVHTSPTPRGTPTEFASTTATLQARNTPTYTPTATASTTSTPTATPSPAPTVTPSATDSPTPAATVTHTPDSTPTDTATSTVTDTPSPTYTNTTTQTPTSAISATPTLTETATQTPSASATSTSTPGATATTTSTTTETALPSPTPTHTSTATATELPATPSPTLVATHTPTSTVTPTASPSGTATTTPSATPTDVVDPFEPNDAFDLAYGPLTFGVTYAAYIWTADDWDYYKVDIPDLGTLTLDLTNIPSGADYDLVLYDDERIWLAGSNTPDNVDEFIFHPALWPGTYYIAVFPFGEYFDQLQPYRLTANFQPGRAVLLADDFDDPGSGWPVSDDETGTQEYVDGEYRIRIKNIDLWNPALAPGYFRAPYVVEMDGRLVSPIRGSYGLVFESADDASFFYAFQVYSEGQASLSKYSNGAWEVLVPWTPFSFVHPGQASNHLQVVRQNSLIRAYVNGQKVAEVEDSQLSGDFRVGLLAAADTAAGVDVRFDNFRVSTVSTTSQKVQIETQEGAENRNFCNTDRTLAGACHGL